MGSQGAPFGPMAIGAWALWGSLALEDPVAIGDPGPWGPWSPRVWGAWGWYGWLHQPRPWAPCFNTSWHQIFFVEHKVLDCFYNERKLYLYHTEK